MITNNNNTKKKIQQFAITRRNTKSSRYWCLLPSLFCSPEVICIDKIQQVRFYVKKTSKSSQDAVYYKRADFINKFSFLVPMKIIWNRLYKTHLTTKLINSTFGSSLSPKRSVNYKKNFSQTKSDFILFNKYWNHYTDLSSQQLPLWNFKTFNKDTLLMRCSYDTFSTEVPLYYTSKNFFKTIVNPFFKGLRYIPITYFYGIFLLGLFFCSAFYYYYFAHMSNNFFDFYLTNAFYFIWDIYLAPTNTYFTVMFEYPEFLIRKLLLFDLNINYKGPGYWEYYYLNESELFLALCVKTFLFWQHIDNFDFLNAWMPFKGLSEFFYITKTSYMTYEHILYLTFIPLFTWHFTPLDINKIVVMFLIDTYTFNFTSNIARPGQGGGGISNIAYSYNYSYGMHTGDFKKDLKYYRLKLRLMNELTVDPHTWADRVEVLIINKIRTWRYNTRLAVKDALHRHEEFLTAMNNIFTDLFVNFIYYRSQWFYYKYVEYYVIFKLYEEILINQWYNVYYLNTYNYLYNFFYTYFYWYTTRYVFNLLDFFWNSCWFVIKKIFFIESVYDWWDYFSFRLDMPYFYVLFFYSKEAYFWFLSFLIQLIEFPGYYFKRAWGDFLFIHFLFFLQNNFFFGSWLNIGSFGVQLVSLSFPIYIHDTIFLPISVWTQDLGVLNFYTFIKGIDSLLVSVFYPIAFLFFDTKWSFPEFTLNFYWRPYKTDWYVPETFWFLKRYGPVFFEHIHVKAPFTLFLGTDLFFYLFEFVWNLDYIDKPVIDIHYWSVDFLEQEWVYIFKMVVMDVSNSTMTSEEFFKYANHDIFNKTEISMPFMSFLHICEDFILAGVRVTSGLIVNFYQLCWASLWLVSFTFIFNYDDTEFVITYKNIWADWFLWIFHPFYFSELRLLYIIQDGYLRIEKLKLYLLKYNLPENHKLINWLTNITKSSIFLPASEDIFFKSFLGIVQSTRTIGFWENIKDYFLIRDFYGSNLLLLVNDLWFVQVSDMTSNDIFSSLTVIFWEAYNMWSLDDVDAWEKGDPYAYIDSLDIHNPFISERFFYIREVKEFFLTKYWHCVWIRPTFEHWWYNGSFESIRELSKAEPLWTAIYDRHLWKGYVNYNYNVPYRKSFSVSRSLGFKPGFTTGEPISKFLGLGYDSGIYGLGTNILNDRTSKHQQMLMFRNLNTDPLFIAMHSLPKDFASFFNLVVASSNETPYIKRHDAFMSYSESSSIMSKIFHFIFVDSLYSFFIFSGLPAGYIDTLQLSNPIINLLNLFKFLEVYFFYFLYIALLFNILWNDFIPGHFETYFFIYFIFFSEYSIIKKVFVNEYVAIAIFMFFYKLKLFLLTDFHIWAVSKWEFWFDSVNYTKHQLFPQTFENERFLSVLKKSKELEWFLYYYKWLYNITFDKLWFEFFLTKYFITYGDGENAISKYNYVADFYTWKFNNTSNLWVKAQQMKLTNITQKLNINYMLPYLQFSYFNVIYALSNTINKAFVFIRSNFFFFNEDLILKNDYIKSMLFLNLIIEATLKGYIVSNNEQNILFREYILNDYFFKELNVYFSYVNFYDSTNYILFFNPWTDYLLKNDFNIYEFVWNKRTVRWHGVPGFWYVFDIFYFILFIFIVSILALILDSYMRALAKKGDPWYDFIISIYPELVQRHKKAYLFKDSFIVDEESADNLLEFHKYYYDSLDYIYLPYRSFKSQAVSSIIWNKESMHVDLNPLTGEATYLVDFTNLKKPFTNLFSYNSRFLLQKHAYEADRYFKRTQKPLKHIPNKSWYKYKESFIKKLFKGIPKSVWSFFLVFIVFFSIEYFFFFKRSWLFNFFFFHKISAFFNIILWEELFFSIHPFFFDGIFSIFLLINLFLLWYFCWLLYLFFYLRLTDACLLTSKAFYFGNIVLWLLLWNILHSLRFWKTKAGFLSKNWFFYKNKNQTNVWNYDFIFLQNFEEKQQDITTVASKKISIFLKDMAIVSKKASKRNQLNNQQQKVVYNYYISSYLFNNFNNLDYVDVQFLSKIQYSYFLDKNFKVNVYDISNQKYKNIFYSIDTLTFQQTSKIDNLEHNLLKTELFSERLIESHWMFNQYIKLKSRKEALKRNHNDLSVTFINDFFKKSKDLSLFSKWDLVEILEIFDDMPLVDRGAPREIMDPEVPNFLGDQMPDLLAYVKHQWFRDEDLYAKDFTNLTHREILERSARYVGSDNAWYFVDLHNKLDVSSQTGSFFRKQFYDDLLEQKKIRIETKKAWLEADTNIGVMASNRTFEYTTDTVKDVNKRKNFLNSRVSDYSDFLNFFYSDNKPITIFQSIQGDRFSSEFLQTTKSKDFYIKNLDLAFDLEYDITNL